jgi:large subunit ribosomal protein L23
MHATEVIRKSMITEKCTWEAAARNRYSFVVDRRARKPEIKKAIEDLYGVRVERVSTQVRKGQYFRTRFGTGKTSTWKKATVQLHPEDRIELF